MQRRYAALILFRTASISMRHGACRMVQKRKRRAGMNRCGVIFLGGAVTHPRAGTLSRVRMCVATSAAS
jgi:hypothetical protein